MEDDYEWSRCFCPRDYLLGRYLKQDQLGHLRAWWTPAPRRVKWPFPIQEPLIRAEVEKRRLWGPENCFGHARVTYVFEVSAILVQFHAILGERHGLVFQFERTLIHPHIHWLMRQSSLTIQPPILKPDVPMSIQVAVAE
jgi:hypothetical protein